MEKGFYFLLIEWNWMRMSVHEGRKNVCGAMLLGWFYEKTTTTAPKRGFNPVCRTRMQSSYDVDVAVLGDDFNLCATLYSLCST